MAAGYLPDPGSKTGPCLGDCGHSDCTQTRIDASHQCRICEESIGYGVRFYYEKGVPVHAICLEKEAER